MWARVPGFIFAQNKGAVTTMTQQTKKKRPDPFDGSAVARLRRMGLLTEAGEVDGPAMEAFTHVYAASLFDDLCDAFEDRRELSRALAAFQELAEHQEPKSIFLMISLQYDTLRKPLPDPVWWLAGHVPALSRFSLGFAAYLLQLAEDMEKTEKEDGPNEAADHSAP